MNGLTHIDIQFAHKLAVIDMPMLNCAQTIDIQIAHLQQLHDKFPLGMNVGI